MVIEMTKKFTKDRNYEGNVSMRSSGPAAMKDLGENEIEALCKKVLLIHFRRKRILWHFHAKVQKKQSIEQPYGEIFNPE